MDTRRLLYYADLLIKKLDRSEEAFVERIQAIREGDKNRVEFIEEMMLKPLDYQVKYLARKANESCQSVIEEREQKE